MRRSHRAGVGRISHRPHRQHAIDEADGIIGGKQRAARDDGIAADRRVGGRRGAELEVANDRVWHIAACQTAVCGGEGGIGLALRLGGIIGGDG